MPIYTNNFNIPAEICELLKRGRHAPLKHRFGVTSLAVPYLMRELERRHWDELVIDYSELLFMLQGKAFHLLMEQAGGSNVLKEQKLEMRSASTNIEIAGILDRFELDTNLLKDYKTTSVWAAIRGAPLEWTEQTNVYAYLLKECLNVHAASCMAVVFFRDWSKNKAKQGKGYPQCALMSFETQLWSFSDTKAYIGERVKGHLEAQNTPTGELPQCSALETWQHPDQFAVIKKGNKKACRGGLLDSPEEAQEFIKTQQVLDAAKKKKIEYNIEVRPGAKPRCDDYCFAKQVCPYMQP